MFSLTCRPAHSRPLLSAQLCMLGEARARAPVRASLSMVCECLAQYGASLAELTIAAYKELAVQRLDNNYNFHVLVLVIRLLQCEIRA
jgi:hypothetical protein